MSNGLRFLYKYALFRCLLLMVPPRNPNPMLRSYRTMLKPLFLPCPKCFRKTHTHTDTQTHTLIALDYAADLTCSTMDAKRPNAIPWSSSRVITALPSLMTKRRAYLSWLRSENVVCCCSPSAARFSFWLACHNGKYGCIRISIYCGNVFFVTMLLGTMQLKVFCGILIYVYQIYTFFIYLNMRVCIFFIIKTFYWTFGCIVFF